MRGAFASSNPLPRTATLPSSPRRRGGSTLVALAAIGLVLIAALLASPG